MARIIKFRAWDGQEMWTGFHILKSDIIVPPAWRKTTCDLEFLQYTGLKDKNGVEIYEGDIVEFHAFTFNGSETEYDGKGIVKYRNDGMCFVIEEKNDFDWMVRDTSNFGEACFEIIGNIYENPELLEPNKN